MKENFKLITKYMILVKEMMQYLPKLNNDLENNYNICQRICQKIIELSDINLIINGEENIPKDSIFLIASNHRSFFDILLLIAAINRPVSFAAAKELYKVPILYNYMKSIECIPIDRYTENIALLKEQVKNITNHLKSKNLIIFPEGECEYQSNEIKEFKKGGFMQINTLDIQIVPTYISIETMDNIARWYMPSGDVNITFGKSFNPNNFEEKYNAKKLANYTRNQVLSLKKN